MSFVRSAAASFALAAAWAAPAGASTFSPSAPLPFELVNLRMTVDSCAFNPASVFVAQSGGAIQVRLRDNQCLVAGTPRDVDVRLGAFPVGTYNVEVATLNGDIVNVRERLTLNVAPRAVPAIFPPPQFPLTDYSGLWYDPAEPGWGLSIHQRPSDSVFAALFDYTAGAPGAPTWITFQSGQWTTPSVWQGTGYRTTFPPLAVQALGPVTMEFDVAPPVGGNPQRPWARVVYNPPGGGVATKYVTRQPF